MRIGLVLLLCLIIAVVNSATTKTTRPRVVVTAGRNTTKAPAPKSAYAYLRSIRGQKSCATGSCPFWERHGRSFASLRCYSKQYQECTCLHRMCFSSCMFSREVCNQEMVSCLQQICPRCMPTTATAMCAVYNSMAQRVAEALSVFACYPCCPNFNGASNNGSNVPQTTVTTTTPSWNGFSSTVPSSQTEEIVDPSFTELPIEGDYFPGNEYQPGTEPVPGSNQNGQFYPTNNVNGGVFTNTNGNGFANGNGNVYTNGITNGFTNGNGNVFTNGNGNVYTNANGNGINNGFSNGNANLNGINNGYTNVNGNGVSNSNGANNGNGINTGNTNFNGITNGQGNTNFNGITNGQGNANVNGINNGQGNANLNGISNGQGNTNFNGITNGQGNANLNGQGNANVNGISNGQGNTNVNSITNGQGNTNSNTNGNGNSNVNTNTNGNGNSAASGNGNSNSNGNGNLNNPYPGVVFPGSDAMFYNNHFPHKQQQVVKQRARQTVRTTKRRLTTTRGTPVTTRRVAQASATVRGNNVKSGVRKPVQNQKKPQTNNRVQS